MNIIYECVDRCEVGIQDPFLKEVQEVLGRRMELEVVDGIHIFKPSLLFRTDVMFTDQCTYQIL